MNTRKKKVIIISAALAALCITAAAVTWVTFSGRKKLPDFAGKNRQDVINYLQSEEFRKLDQRTRRDLGRQAFGQLMADTARQYCELPPQEKVAYLDKIIDDMETRRKEFAADGNNPFRRRFRDPNDPNGPSQQRRRPRIAPEQMRARMESIDSTTRAQMTEFMIAMRERRQQRGLNNRPWGRGGR